jgi:2-methylisocitrate lyase-like PEP mutase family enzyme
MSNYEHFFGLHQQKKPLVIANIWNVRSAQIMENSGFEAITTSSGAIADSLGYEDDQL